MRFTGIASILLLLALSAGPGSPTLDPAYAQTGDCCVVPDNGNGTASLPPSCSNGYEGSPMQIIDGLPPGEPILSVARLASFFDIFYFAGGTLGGEVDQFKGTLGLDMQGTGGLSGFHRVIQLPTQGEIDAAPRALGSPIQTFATDMYQLQGQITGDPDFDLLRVTAGGGFGLPSPGHTTLTSLPGGTWAVDSFFDITYRIDFIGHPGGPLSGMSGSTTGTIRMATCAGPVPVQLSTWGAVKRLYR
jgi:hypothetical protein